MSFLSDTAAPAHPKILAAVLEANEGLAPSYGSDDWTQAAREDLQRVFGTDLEVWFTSSGTAANALGLAVACPSTGAVLCHREAHIERDERGAPEFFTGGAKLSLADGAHGKIDVVGLDARLAANNPAFVHETPLHVLSLSNLTECGTAYSTTEVRERADRAHAAGLSVHLDGARFGNAVQATGASPAEASWRAGVDVMSFGATKNGALGCEAVILFGDLRRRVDDLRARAKRAGHMPPKMRFVAAQLRAYLKDGLWLELAERSNAAARDLAGRLTTEGGAELAHPTDGNEVFVRLPTESAAKLSDAGIGFYRWHDGSCRFVCSWSTGPEQLGAVTRALRG